MKMHINKIVIAAVALLISSQVAAQNPKGFQVKTTANLVQLCSASVNDPAYNEAMGFCFGYMDAAMHYHQALVAGKNKNPIACPHAKVTRKQLAGVLVEWSKHNEQYLYNETPVHGVMRAAAEKWPC